MKRSGVVVAGLLLLLPAACSDVGEDSPVAPSVQARHSGYAIGGSSTSDTTSVESTTTESDSTTERSGYAIGGS